MFNNDVYRIHKSLLNPAGVASCHPSISVGITSPFLVLVLIRRKNGRTIKSTDGAISMSRRPIKATHPADSKSPNRRWVVSLVGEVVNSHKGIDDTWCHNPSALFALLSQLRAFERMRERLGGT